MRGRGVEPLHLSVPEPKGANQTLNDWTSSDDDRENASIAGVSPGVSGVPPVYDLRGEIALRLAAAAAVWSESGDAALLARNLSDVVSALFTKGSES